MKVRVKEGLKDGFFGYYEHERRRTGDVFELQEQPRRALFPKEKSEMERGNAEYKAAYEAIKDADGKVPQAFSFAWMQPVSAGTPTKSTTAQQVVDKKSSQIKSERAAERAPDSGDGNDVI